MSKISILNKNIDLQYSSAVVFTLHRLIQMYFKECQGNTIELWYFSRVI